MDFCSKSFLDFGQDLLVRHGLARFISLHDRDGLLDFHGELLLRESFGISGLDDLLSSFYTHCVNRIIPFILVQLPSIEIRTPLLIRGRRFWFGDDGSASGLPSSVDFLLLLRLVGRFLLLRP
uniref:Uncharacterized protein n=1 Tax=Arcella intermedia TaxID=1963864 RepID=A0A6B2LRI9_9EUKA